MKTSPTNYYEMLSLGLGNSKFAWQQFVDRFKEKYNLPQTDGFVWDPEIQLDYTYEQLQVELGIATLPVYVDAEAEALDKARGGFKVGSNKIPTQKHRYPINTRILREQAIMMQRYGEAAITDSAKQAILNLLFDSTDKLLAGNQNALTHQRMQVVSTGKFMIDSENNPRGLQGITFDFGVVAIAALTGNARWWTSSTHTTANEGSDADPIEDMKKVIRAKKKLGWPSLHIEIAQDLYKLTESAGFVGITWLESGIRCFYTKDTAVRTPADLNGLKIRTMQSDMAIAMMDAFNASAMAMGYGDIYTAMQTGVVDGAENNVTALRDHMDVTKYYCYDEHTMIPDVIVISSKVWNEMSDAQKEVMNSTALDMTANYRELWAAFEQEVIDAATAKGVEFVTDVDKDAFLAAVQPIYDNLKANDAATYAFVERIQAA